MTRWLLRSLLLVGVLVVPGLALAQVTPAAGYTPPDDTQSIKLGAVIYYDFTQQYSPKATDADGNTINPSSFNVSRAYVNITGNISHVVAFRITPDVSRETGTGSSLQGSLNYRVKYAFAQFNLDQWTGDWKSTWARLGIQQTPYVDYQEGIYRYRFQGTIFVEREGALTSSDAGASFHSNLPNNYGEVHFGLYNGEGYSKLETNNQKAFQVRGTARPFARTSSVVARGVRVTAFYDADHYAKSDPRSRFVFDTTFEHAHLNAGFDYLDQADQPNRATTKVDAHGWSFWATPVFKTKGDGFEALIRYDDYTPNDAASAQQRHRTIAGVSYWFPHPGGTSTAALLLDYEQVTFPGTTTVTQKKLAVHGLINF